MGKCFNTLGGLTAKQQAERAAGVQPKEASEAEELQHGMELVRAVECVHSVDILEILSRF